MCIRVGAFRSQQRTSAGRKAHASTFNPFVVYSKADVLITGELAHWASSAEYIRSFCPRCGSRFAGQNEDDIELSLETFDCVGFLSPSYEGWVKLPRTLVAAAPSSTI